MSAFGRLLRKLSVDQWRAIDDDINAELASKPAAVQAQARLGGAFEWRALVVLLVVCLSLTVQEYWGERALYMELYPRQPGDDYWHLKSFGWWTGWRFGGYVLIPMIAILLMPGERIRDYFISPKGFIRHLWIYVGLFVLVFPAVYIASKTESFQRTYPFYKWANRSMTDFLIWEAMYAVQFLSLEFFFRGFMLHGLRYSMGSKAIFVMIVPYCMIHYGKPMPETLGAIGAGLILGTVAMRTRSIWGGVLIHVGVAITMDFLAVGHCPSADSNLPCKGH